MFAFKDLNLIYGPLGVPFIVCASSSSSSIIGDLFLCYKPNKAHVDQGMTNFAFKLGFGNETRSRLWLLKKKEKKKNP